mgnify:CR=1 FL=1
MRTFKTVLVFLAIALLVIAFVVGLVGAITGSVFGLFDFAVITSFFEGVTAEQLLTVAITGLLSLWPKAFVTFFNWLKNMAGLEDEQANDFVLVLAFLVAGTVMFITGTLDLNGLEFKFTNIMLIGGEIYTFTQVAYKRWFKQ